MAETDFSLVDGRGQKYLTLPRHTRFLDAVRGDPRREVRTFALTLVHTGCRICEAMRTRQIGLSRVMASRPLNGPARLTAATALAIERLDWGDAEYWMRLQASDDLAQERRKQAAA